MTPIETTIIQTLITKTKSGALRWRAEKDKHYATINSINDTRIEVLDIGTGILPVHLFQNDLHLDTISLTDSSKAIELLNAIVAGRGTRLNSFSAYI